MLPRSEGGSQALLASRAWLPPSLLGNIFI